MSRGAAFFLLLLAPACGSAQNLARLERMWKDAALASGRVDSLARVRMRDQLDTVRAGNLIVMAPARLGPLAAAAAPMAWSRLEHVYGTEARGAGKGPLVVALYRSDSGPPPYGFPPDALPIPVSPVAPDPVRLAAQMGMVLSQKLRARLDPPLDHWVSEAITTIPPESAAPDLFEDLVTSPSPLARSCYVGSLSACGTALGLVTPRDAATEWYDPSGRRELVRHLLPDHKAPWYDQCVEQGVDAACLHVLRGPDSASLMVPLMAASRELMVRIAIGLGGPQAFHRLLASAGQPLARRLELASGAPLDSLLTRWRTTVLTTRPTLVNLTSQLGWVALAWAIVFGGLVLRSSKWRV